MDESNVKIGTCLHFELKFGTKDAETFCKLYAVFEEDVMVERKGQIRFKIFIRK